MKANYHTHTKRCNHASGEIEEYVLAAIDAGLKTLGFSDHTPYVFDVDGYYSRFRMRERELPEYVADVNSLKEKYKDKIKIFCGVEIEYYPEYFAETLRFLRENGVEYMILGQHFVDDEINNPYVYFDFADEDYLRRYCDQCIEALKTGLFTYLAHPDVARFKGEDSVYEKHMRRLCKAAKEMNIPLEINLLGVQDGRDYPRELFWEIAAQEGCSAIFGFDAHRPDALLDTAAIEKAKSLYVKEGLTLLEDVEIKRI